MCIYPLPSACIYVCIDILLCVFGLPQWLSSKESAWNAGPGGYVGSIPGSGRSPGEGNGYPLQYSCLENPMGWSLEGTVHSVTKSRTWLKLLSAHIAHIYLIIRFYIRISLYNSSLNIYIHTYTQISTGYKYRQIVSVQQSWSGSVHSLWDQTQQLWLWAWRFWGSGRGGFGNS